MSSEKVPFIRPTFPSTEEMAEVYAEVVASNWFTNFGPQEQRFSAGLADHLGQDLSVSTFANGTLALLAAVQSVMGRGDGGQRLIVPSFTFVAAPQAALWCGYQPAWCDIAPDTWQPDVAAAREILVGGRDEVAGIVMANVFGVGDPRIAEWEELAAEWDLPLVVDSAAGFGSDYADGEKVGGRGTCEIFSFHATKPFAIGEGGALATRDPDLARRTRSFQNFGFDESRASGSLGVNAKLQELNAAIGLRQLVGFEDRLAARRQVHATYREALSGAGLTFQVNADRSALCFAAAVADTAEHRDALLAAWERAGVEARAYYNPPVHRHPLFAGSGDRPGLPVTDDVASRSVSIPIHDDMPPDTVERVVRAALSVGAGERA